ncbi:MAG: 5-formyltetrahydrofolate cyclo-ligase [Spongiibacteraceae bacterium]|jgi:5-formyltetrahydrofolate cyclo-ligase|nr:5-formyltetrahydrofolate cyclo-ligase [Spongiibacteraceae bacterium]
MADATATQKRELRRSLRRRRRALSPAQQHLAGQRLARVLGAQAWFRHAQDIALYLPADGEIDTLPILDLLWHRQKHAYLPVMRPAGQLWFLRCEPGDPLGVNRYGLLEPRWRRRRIRPWWSLDLMLLPLVAFDAAGYRLGMGGGFYDRMLASGPRRPRLVGLAHALQEVPAVPREAWDQRLDAVATDEAWHPAAPDAA